MAAGHLPGHRAAPVVADEVEAVEPECVGHAQHVGQQLGRPVGLDLGRAGAGRVAPLIERARPVAGLGQGGDLGRPRQRGLGEAVQEEHRLAVLGPVDASVEGERPDRDVDA
jgi:hypothetical protein